MCGHRPEEEGIHQQAGAAGTKVVKRSVLFVQLSTRSGRIGLSCECNVRSYREAWGCGRPRACLLAPGVCIACGANPSCDLNCTTGAGAVDPPLPTAIRCTVVITLLCAGACASTSTCRPPRRWAPTLAPMAATAARCTWATWTLLQRRWVGLAFYFAERLLGLCAWAGLSCWRHCGAPRLPGLR